MTSPELGVAADDREVRGGPSELPWQGAAIGTVAEAGVTVYLAYFGTNGQLVLSSNDLEKTRAALGL